MATIQKMDTETIRKIQRKQILELQIRLQQVAVQQVLDLMLMAEAEGLAETKQQTVMHLKGSRTIKNGVSVLSQVQLEVVLALEAVQRAREAVATMAELAEALRKKQLSVVGLPRIVFLQR